MLVNDHELLSHDVGKEDNCNVGGWTQILPTEGTPWNLHHFNQRHRHVTSSLRMRNNCLGPCWVSREDEVAFLPPHLNCAAFDWLFMMIELHSTHLSASVLNGSSSYLLSTIYSSADEKGGWLFSFSCRSPKGAGSFDNGLCVDDHIDVSRAVEKEVACLVFEGQHWYYLTHWIVFRQCCPGLVAL